MEAHSITIDGRLVTLVDTPGFDDVERTDAQVLKEVAYWLTVAYETTRRLSGIIYLHPILHSRMTGSMVKNLAVFEKLVGADNFEKVILVTTMWDALKDGYDGVRREQELKEKHWASMIERGSVTARSAGDRASVLRIVERIAFDQRASSLPVLAIQREMVDEHKSLADTGAAKVLRQEMREMQQRHNAEMVELRSGARSEFSRTIDTLQRRLDSLQRELAETRKGEEAAQEVKSEWDRRLESLQNPRAQVKSQDELDLPPLYLEIFPEDLNRPLGLGLGDALSFIDMLSKSAITASAKFLRRLMRPPIPDGYTRLDWIGVSDLHHSRVIYG